MSRYTFLCLLLLAPLVGCPGGSRQGPDASLQPGSHRLEIVSPSGGSLRLEPREQATLEVRYLDPEGKPVPGAELSFTMQGETGGATLGSFRAITSSAGLAEMGLVAGTEAVIFTVDVSAPNALPVHFEVAVSAQGFVSIQVVPIYQGSHDATAFAQVAAELYFGDRCQDLDPLHSDQPERVRTTTEGFGQVLLLEDLPVDLSYSVAVVATDPTDRVLAWGCADVASLQLVPGATVRLELAAQDLVPDVSGVFQVDTTIELTQDQAEAMLETLAPLAALGRCPFGPVQRLLDCVVDAATDDGVPDCIPESTEPLALEIESLRGMLDPNGCRLPESPMGEYSLESLVWSAMDATGIASAAALADLADLSSSELSILRLRSRLTLVADPGGLRHFMWHRLEELSWPAFSPGSWLLVSELGGLLQQVSGLEADLANGDPPLLGIPAHDLTLRPLQATLAAAHARFLAPAGLSSDLGELVSSLLVSLHFPTPDAELTGCSALDEHLCDAISGQTTCPQDACSRGVSLLLDLARQSWSTLPLAYVPDVSFAADISIVDEDGDLQVSQLGSPAEPLSWSLELNLGEAWVAPQSATFAATRIAPAPQ